MKDFSLVTEILGGPQAETVKVFYATHMSRHTGQPLAASPLYGCRVPFTGKTFLYLELQYKCNMKKEVDSQGILH